MRATIVEQKITSFPKGKWNISTNDMSMKINPMHGKNKSVLINLSKLSVTWSKLGEGGNLDS